MRNPFSDSNYDNYFHNSDFLPFGIVFRMAIIAKMTIHKLNDKAIIPASRRAILSCLPKLRN